MTKKEFINKHWHDIYKVLCKEGYELGYTDDEIDDYVRDTYPFIFVETEAEVKDELKENKHYIIAQDDNLMIVETFDGTSYEGTEYGIV